MGVVTVIVSGSLMFLIVCAGIFLAQRFEDYRRFGYMGMSASFSVLLFGLVSGGASISDEFLAIGFSLLFASCGIFILMRAADLLLQDKNFYLKAGEKKNSEDSKCKKQQQLSAPLKLFKSLG